jgi:hypothetical protein
VGAPACVCDRSSQPRIASAERLHGAENRNLRAHLPARLRLSNPQRSTLAEIGQRLGRKALAQMACVAKPDTILAWYWKLIAHKFDGSKHRSCPGRSRVDAHTEALILQMAGRVAWGTTGSWGHFPNLGYRFSDQSVGNVVKRHGIAPAPKPQVAVSIRFGKLTSRAEPYLLLEEAVDRFRPAPVSHESRIGRHLSKVAASAASSALFLPQRSGPSHKRTPPLRVAAAGGVLGLQPD